LSLKANQGDMSFFHRLSKNSVRLFILGQTLLLFAFAFRDFPIFIFFAFAPLFALVDNPTGLKDSYLPFIVATVTAFTFYFTMRESMQQSSVLSWIVYFAMLAGVFTVYFLVQKWVPGVLNKFALIIFIVGIEYVFLKLAKDFNPVFLADLLQNKTNWTRWNVVTGYAGSTVWILVVNLVIYYAVFVPGKINWFLAVVAALLILLPIVYSFNISGIALTKLDVIAFYYHNVTNNSLYSERGELISRTGAWVSVLIVIFTLVKGLTKKVSR
jgi:apolipoprotein N-acyltransferase